jgi:diguanylate cyclase (GGDEF)-like protein
MEVAAGRWRGKMRALRTTALLLAMTICVSAALASGSAPLTSLRSIHELSNAEASHQPPVSFEATVTYYRAYERTLFVQDGDVAIYVQPGVRIDLAPGDHVQIKGTAHDSFRPFVVATSISVLGRAPLPKPVPATWDQLIRAQFDSRLVTVRATVRNVDLVMTSDRPSIQIQMRAEGGPIDAIIDSDKIDALKGILDDEVEITGAESGHFDGKMQQTGVLLHLNSLDGVKVLKHAPTDPWSLPLTPMDEVLTSYHARDNAQRVRVHGTITFYQPGEAAVLQEGSKSLWVMTKSSAPLNIGNKADAIGFGDVHDGFLTLTGGEIRDRQVPAPIDPRLVTWSELATSHYLFDLVSIEGKVVAETRGAAQDEYVLDADGELFSAIIRQPPPRTSNPAPPPPMRLVPLGAKIRVTGICVMGDSNPFDTQVPFDILLRSSDDIAVVGSPSWLTVVNLIRIVGALLVIVLIVGAWAWTLRVKVRRQTAVMTVHAEAEAATERHNAQLENRRSRILEDINSSRPLNELIEQITNVVSFSMNGALCWCEMTDGTRIGMSPSDMQNLRVLRREIPAGSGGSHGTLFAALETPETSALEEAAALESGIRLATLSIETRKLYKDLLYRSEFDLLTDIYNRFSLERYLDEQVAKARENESVFGLIYIDLDEFKQVNDQYGHHVGDLYLQEMSLRMKRQLRSGDMLARLGGDEFAALVPVIRNRGAVEEIAIRLERCFDAPFAVEGYVLRGAASVGFAIYPEDGRTADSLLSAADAAMYVSKHTKRNHADKAGRLQASLFNREEFRSS